jgi:hypothetical protein
LGQVIKIECAGAGTLLLEDFNELQGDLKTLLKEDYEKLRKEILVHGFSFPPNVWFNPEDKKFYLLDGHQRVRTLKQLVKQEGYECPPVPYSVTHARTWQQAKRKLLGAASQYGRLSSEGLLEYIQDMEINPDELSGSYRFADMDIHKFIESNFELNPVTELDDYDETVVVEEDGIRHASAGVRMVQLFFNDSNHPEFLNKVNKLSSLYGKDNVTDTVMELVLESYKTHFPNE